MLHGGTALVGCGRHGPGEPRGPAGLARQTRRRRGQFGAALSAARLVSKSRRICVRPSKKDADLLRCSIGDTSFSAWAKDRSVVVARRRREQPRRNAQHDGGRGAGWRRGQEGRHEERQQPRHLRPARRPHELEEQHAGGESWASKQPTHILAGRRTYPANAEERKVSTPGCPGAYAVSWVAYLQLCRRAAPKKALPPLPSAVGLVASLATKRRQSASPTMKPRPRAASPSRKPATPRS